MNTRWQFTKQSLLRLYIIQNKWCQFRMNISLNCFLGSQSSFWWWVWVSCVSPFPSFDLTFVDQLGGTVYWRHVRNSIYNQNIKGLNPNLIYHHYSFISKIEINSTSKGECGKIMTIKIWLRNLDKCWRSRNHVCMYGLYHGWSFIVVI